MEKPYKKGKEPETLVIIEVFKGKPLFEGTMLKFIQIVNPRKIVFVYPDRKSEEHSGCVNA